MSKIEIQDKNKADGLVKLTALCQLSYFVVQCIARTAHDLPIAPLESMTIAYIFVVLITYLFWWVKPKDIATATFVDLPPMRPEQMRIFQSLAMEDAYDNDFPGNEPSKNTAWYLVSRDIKDGVAEQTENVAIDESGVITQWDEGLYMTRYWPIICIVGAAFGALHLISWDSTFPTLVEQWLWRASALMSVLTSIVCMQFRVIALRWDGPLTIISVSSSFLYGVSRVIMIGEVFAALRGMPPGIYDTYVISSYWLHFL